MNLLAGQAHYLSATTPIRFEIRNSKLETNSKQTRNSKFEFGHWNLFRVAHFAFVLPDTLSPRGPGRSSPSRPRPFQQRTNTSCYRSLAIPTHGFTVVLSVFGGTPSTKPLKFKSKIRLGSFGSDLDLAWAYHTGDDSKLVFANFTFALPDITWMPLYC